MTFSNSEHLSGIDFSKKVFSLFLSFPLLVFISSPATERENIWLKRNKWADGESERLQKAARLIGWRRLFIISSLTNSESCGSRPVALGSRRISVKFCGAPYNAGSNINFSTRHQIFHTFARSLSPFPYPTNFSLFWGNSLLLLLASAPSFN